MHPIKMTPIGSYYVPSLCMMAVLCLAVASNSPSLTREEPLPTTRTNFYLEENGTLKFHYVGSEKSIFTKDGVELTQPTTPGFRAFTAPDGKSYIVKYQILEAKPKDSGTYLCKLSSQDIKDELHLSVVTITPMEAPLIAEHVPVTIGCSASLVNDATLKWYKKGKELVQDGEHHNISDSNKTLTVIKPTRKDIGAYECVFFPEKSSTTVNITGRTYVTSSPYVNEFERSKNLVQGDSVKVDCHVFGYPVPTVKWFRLAADENSEDQELDGKNGSRISFGEFNGVPNAQLRIADLVMEDGGEYRCMATDGLNSTSQDITIRVKDKYAALWPFLGIVVEVVVLCAIIFIYEKKRGKRHEEDDSPAMEKTNSHDHKAEDLRQRNKNVKA